MTSYDSGRNVQAFFLWLLAIVCGWGTEVAMFTAYRAAPVVATVHASSADGAEAEQPAPQPVPVESGGQTAALMIGLAGVVGAAGTLLKGWYEHNQRMRLLEQGVVDDRKELQMWRRWGRAINRDHKVPFPEWAWDWQGEPHSGESTPPIVAVKKQEDTVDLPRAD